MARKLNTLNKGLFNSNNLKKSPERKVGKKESLGKKLGKFALPLMLMGNMVSCDWQNPYMKEFFKDKEQPQKPGYEQPAPEPETPEVEQPTPEQPTPEPEQPTPEQPTPEQPTPEPEQPTPEPEQPEQPPVEEEPDYCDRCEDTQGPDHVHDFCDICDDIQYDEFHYQDYHGGEYEEEPNHPTEEPDYDYEMGM